MPNYNPIEKKKGKDEKNNSNEDKESKNLEYDKELHQWINEIIRAFRQSGNGGR